MAGGSPLKCRAPYLHGVVGVLVVEDEGLLAELVVSLQLVDVGFVVDDVLLVLLQAVHLFLQGAGDVHGHVADLLRAGDRTRHSKLLLTHSQFLFALV